MTKKTKPPPKSTQVSVRGETFDKLRAYCRAHGVQIKTVVDSLILQAIDERAKEN